MNEKTQAAEQEGVHTHTFLIYDPRSGDLIHGHKEVVLPYGDAPSEEQLRENALSAAAEVTGRRSESLRVLEVSEDELKPGLGYRVDPSSERLESFELRPRRGEGLFDRFLGPLTSRG